MSKPKEFKMNNLMSDVIFAGFAQLSYLDWHKLKASQGKKLSSILGKDTLAFNQIKTSDYDDMYLSKEEEKKLKQEIIQEAIKGNGFKLTKPVKGNKEDSAVKDYLKLSKDGHKIYSAKDARLFYLYSEHKDNPNENPKYPDFGEWQLKN